MKTNEMVERLAEKWDNAYAGQEYPDDDPERHEVACTDAGWWLNAIADELKTVRHLWSSRWLRAQAKEDNPHDEQNATQPDSNREG